LLDLQLSQTNHTYHEKRIRNAKVGGSIPLFGTKKIKQKAQSRDWAFCVLAVVEADFINALPPSVRVIPRQDRVAQVSVHEECEENMAARGKRNILLSAI